MGAGAWAIAEAAARVASQSKQGNEPSDAIQLQAAVSRYASTKEGQDSRNSMAYMRQARDASTYKSGHMRGWMDVPD